MKRKPALSITQTMLTGTCGSLLAASGFLLLAACLPAHQRPHGALLVAFTVLTLGGIVIAAVFQTYLRNGVASERWSPEAVDAAQRSVAGRMPNLIGFALLAAYLPCVAVSLSGVQNRQWFNACGWAAFVVGMNFLHMRNALRPMLPSSHSALSGWSDLKPLQSDHWGGR